MQASEVQLRGQIDALLARAAREDKAEADEPQVDIPAEIARREQRLAVIAAAQGRLRERQREADTKRGRDPDDTDQGGGGQKKAGPAFKRPFGEPLPKAQDNFTDPDSRIMKSSAGFEQCYNGQTAVDAHAQIIVAAELTQCASDAGELPGMIEAVVRNTGTLPDVALADAGYRSEGVLAKLSTSGIEVIVALGREGKRQVSIHPEQLPQTAAMAVKLDTPQGSARYRRRKAIVEPPNAWIKHIIGFRQFSFRGVAKVRCEFQLICAALNLRRMATMSL